MEEYMRNRSFDHHADSPKNLKALARAARGNRIEFSGLDAVMPADWRAGEPVRKVTPHRSEAVGGGIGGSFPVAA
jgi:hypothetical protein